MQDTKTYPPDISALEQRFFSSVLAKLQLVSLYHYDELVQAQARSCLPGRLLVNDSKDINKAYLKNLLVWFRSEFFSWTNSPKCNNCEPGETKFEGMVEPTQDDLAWDASRVECYRCTSCQQIVRFPRYNNPVKLLETRTGRCGEWANCFFLLLLSVGFDARMAYDWTDHVWVEVYLLDDEESTAQHDVNNDSDTSKLCGGNWVHCDMCEGGLDSPLLYESGWNKKLTYVMAVSKDEIRDVSWRYTARAHEMLQRRFLVREKRLVQWLESENARLQQAKAEPLQKVIHSRYLKDLAVFVSNTIAPKVATAEESKGRISGDLAWREQRGELGTGKNQLEQGSGKIIELADGQLSMLYSSVQDSYQGTLSGKGWDSLTYSAQNIQRKEELDWGMVYLCRVNGDVPGLVKDGPEP